MAGKNKIERGFRIYWDDSGTTARDLTGDLIPGTITGGGLKLDEVDFTGGSDYVKKALGGFAESPVSGQFHMNDTATTGATTVLNGTINTIGTLTLQWGQNGAAPTTNDLEWEGEYVLIDASITTSNGKFIHNVEWRPAAGQSDPAWGTV